MLQFAVGKYPKPDILKEAVKTFDQSVTLEIVESLVNCWPKQTNLDDLAKEELGPNEVWDRSEAYFVHLATPASILNRLKVWQFK